MKPVQLWGGLQAAPDAFMNYIDNERSRWILSVQFNRLDALNGFNFNSYTLYFIQI
jgi:hypothetical protein